ncbi:MAG: hypothetical protein INF52_08840 [Rhodobacter sp.]|nr:hypothetical protein [Rhodobacter sp.]
MAALPERHFLPRALARGDIANLLVDTGTNRVLSDMGHVAFRVSSGDAELINIVDVVHNYVTGMAHPEWTPIVDQDPGLAAATRAKLLDQLATDRTLTMAYHFPFPGLGHVARRDSAYEWVPAPWVW